MSPGYIRASTDGYTGTGDKGKSMTLQRLETVPAVCQNKACESYRAFETVEVEEIKEDEQKRGYVICLDCGKRILVD